MFTPSAESPAAERNLRRDVSAAKDDRAPRSKRWTCPAVAPEREALRVPLHVRLARRGSRPPSPVRSPTATLARACDRSGRGGRAGQRDRARPGGGEDRKCATTEPPLKCSLQEPNAARSERGDHEGDDPYRLREGNRHSDKVLLP